jgi:hypothetical protein
MDLFRYVVWEGEGACSYGSVSIWSGSHCNQTNKCCTSQQRYEVALTANGDKDVSLAFSRLQPMPGRYPPSRITVPVSLLVLGQQLFADWKERTLVTTMKQKVIVSQF